MEPDDREQGQSPILWILLLAGSIPRVCSLSSSQRGSARASNTGLRLLALHLHKPAPELTHFWHADEAGLLRLLPQVPAPLVLQNVVNGLVDHATDAMASGGRRPRLVRWNWQRDVTHHFRYREKSMRFFADGLVALCVRRQQSVDRILDEWYGLFLLFTELGDERLMRLRLERLLCWRESPERWSLYTHMPPVLILAGTPRQREHWQRAVEAAKQKLKLDAPAGALASLPASAPGSVRKNWQNGLRTQMPGERQPSCSGERPGFSSV